MMCGKHAMRRAHTASSLEIEATARTVRCSLQRGLRPACLHAYSPGATRPVLRHSNDHVGSLFGPVSKEVLYALY